MVAMGIVYWLFFVAAVQQTLARGHWVFHGVVSNRNVIADVRC